MNPHRLEQCSTEQIVRRRDVDLDWPEIARGILDSVKFKPVERIAMVYLREALGMSYGDIGDIFGLLRECVEREILESVDGRMTAKTQKRHDSLKGSAKKKIDRAMRSAAKARSK